MPAFDIALPSAPTEHGIRTIDTGFVRPRFDAAYLIIDHGRAAFVDCGTNQSVPRLLEALQENALTPDDVDWLILTHVHLDHAGGAGELMTRLPRAKLVVHPRGARHMVDPSALWAGAAAVYGEPTMHATYGQLRPVAAERIVEASDGHVVDLAGRALRCIETPGHARHHLAVYDPDSRSCFTGDTFGLSYRELDTGHGPFILPTTTPVQFEPEALHASIDRLLALEPQAMYLTHFGRVEGVTRLARALHALIDAMTALALSLREADDRHRRLTGGLAALYLANLHTHGWLGDETAMRRVLGMDIELNAQGLSVWLDRARR